MSGKMNDYSLHRLLSWTLTLTGGIVVLLIQGFAWLTYLDVLSGMSGSDPFLKFVILQPMQVPIAWCVVFGGVVLFSAWLMLRQRVIGGLLALVSAGLASIMFPLAFTVFYSPWAVFFEPFWKISFLVNFGVVLTIVGGTLSTTLKFLGSIARAAIGLIKIGGVIIVVAQIYAITLLLNIWWALFSYVPPYPGDPALMAFIILVIILALYMVLGILLILSGFFKQIKRIGDFPVLPLISSLFVLVIGASFMAFMGEFGFGSPVYGFFWSTILVWNIGAVLGISGGTMCLTLADKEKAIVTD